MIDDNLAARLAGLPITGVLPALLGALERTPNAVLIAPPGAGKTTGVPPALLAAPWLADRKILMLEPRRLAARAAARRISALFGEEVGGIAGYRVRMEARIGPRTRIEVITDGIFTRMIQEDPSLDRVGAVLFDEFHERRIETDLGLALALDAQGALRPDLRLLVMSATLDAEPVAALLGGAPVVVSDGRAFPVEIRHRDAPPPGPDGLAAAVGDAVLAALAAAPGDVLVFLPGAAEIRRVARGLAAGRLPNGTELHELYGDLPPEAQDRAIAPAPMGRRKVVLATSIAETSLTIEGVRQVVDSGLARIGKFDPANGMTRLETVRVTRAGADQRAGRAGRLAPGIAWRLWPAPAHGALAPHALPEIALADLAAFALELACWGIDDPGVLRLLDPPNRAAFETARVLLRDLGALDRDGRVSAHGRRMARLGLPPRLAHMVLASEPTGDGGTACLVAALVAEGDPTDARFNDADLRDRVAFVAQGRGEGARRIARVAERVARQAGLPRAASIDPAATGRVLLAAYPDRIGRRREQAGEGARYLLSGGQGAVLAKGDALAREPWLVIADLDGQRGDARIWRAAPISVEAIERLCVDRIETLDVVTFDPATGAVAARRERRLGAIKLAEAVIADADPAAIVTALLGAIQARGIGALLEGDAGAAILRARVAFLRAREGADLWPDWSDAALAATLEEWLGPHLIGIRRIDDVATLDLAAILGARLGWEARQALDRRAPSHVDVPSGSRIIVDYGDPEAPAISVKLQELFGATATPAIDDGRCPLVLRLLSPAQRPIQVTRDLPRFWTGSYAAVRSELRGRYPKHPWPEDPLTAPPTARAKPRGR